MIFEALQSPSCCLQNLNMTKTDITFLAGINPSFNDLQSSSSFTQLVNFTLDNNQLRVKSAGRIAALISMSRQLQNISLRNCSIEDACFTSLCNEITNHKFLKKMDMCNNRITDTSIKSGIAYIMNGLCKKPPLADLQLASNMITGEGAQYLMESLVNCSTIQRVNLANNQLSDEFVIWLQMFLRNNRLYNKINNPTQIDLQDNGLLADLSKVKHELHENHLLNINKGLPQHRREAKRLRGVSQ